MRFKRLMTSHSNADNKLCDSRQCSTPGSAFMNSNNFIQNMSSSRPSPRSLTPGSQGFRSGSPWKNLTSLNVNLNQVTSQTESAAPVSVKRKHPSGTADIGCNDRDRHSKRRKTSSSIGLVDFESLNQETLAYNSTEGEYDLVDHFGSYDTNFSNARQQLPWPVPEGLVVIENLSNKELETFQYADLVLTWQNGERKLEYMGGLMSQCLLELEEKLGPRQFYIGSRVTSADRSICSSPTDVADIPLENNIE